MAKRRIAAARNGGARASHGDVLCFVDADSIVHPQVLNAIDESFTDRYIAGSSGVVPERWSLGLRLTYASMMAILWAFDMDSGVFFCRREDFETVGGYDESRLYAEDVHFFMALRTLGKKRRPRQKLLRLRGVTTLTSMRKYDKHGDWHLFGTMLRYLVRRPFQRNWDEKFARGYWYEDR